MLATAVPFAVAAAPVRPASAGRCSPRRSNPARWLPATGCPPSSSSPQAHGVSRTVVREAVHQLRSHGLVRSRQGSGVFVAAPPRNRALAFDPDACSSRCRRWCRWSRCAACSRARSPRSPRARHARAGRGAAAGAEGDRQRAADGGDGVAEDLAFHRAIGEATGNPQFGCCSDSWSSTCARHGSRGNEARRVDFMEDVRDEHRAIVDAIAGTTASRRAGAAVDHTPARRPPGAAIAGLVELAV